MPRERTRLSFVRVTWQRMQRYLADPDLPAKGGFALIETLLAGASADAALVALARTSTKVDFAHSRRLRTVLTDVLSRQDAADSPVIAAAREMTGAELADLMVEWGLYERLQGDRPAV